MQVGAVALEELVRGQRQENVEIAGGPPRTPASPSPASRMRVPSSTPGGMLTESVRSRVTRPEPVQDGQASSIIWPRPWQPGQVRSSVKKPWPAAPGPRRRRSGRSSAWCRPWRRCPNRIRR